MEAVAIASVATPAAGAPGPADARIALLGTGTVGTALLERLARMEAGTSRPGLRLVHVANSRRALSTSAGVAPVTAAGALARSLQPSTLDGVAARLVGTDPGIVVDATGSDAVAAMHAPWLASGLHVVTASKLGQGVALSRWQAIRAACARAGTRYGDSATVGAGLPLLRSLRALREGGDAIHGIAGVMSGSMAWLFSAFDGLRPFSGFVRQARDAGYTEPDPRDDLSGEDVRRKLLILARSAGFALEAGDVEVETLVPPELASMPADRLDASLSLLDGPLRERFADAWKRGERLRHVGRLAVEGGVVHARVGVESLPSAHPLVAGSGTDNRVAIWCDRYPVQPLVVQGPGAGAEVTAAALLDDVLRIARCGMS